MDEGKLASEALAEPDDVLGSEGDDAIKMKGRFRSPVASGLDLAGGLNESDDDEAISRMAKRFRGPGMQIAHDVDAPSLDTQEADAPNLSDDELQDFLLDALDADDSAEEDYEIEEVEPSQPAEDRSSSPKVPAPKAAAVSIDATDRMVEPPAGASLAFAAPAVQVDKQGSVCPSCHATNPAGMRFCVQCGGSLKGATAPGTGVAAREQHEPHHEPPPPSEASKQQNPWDVHLVSINEDGSDGISIPLEFLETTLGRDGDTRFPTDAFLSPKHARLHIENGALFIEDLYSLNGTFLKLSEDVRLTPGDSFLMGRQVLRFERFEQSITPKTKSSDSTRYMGSPAPGGDYKILQIGIGNIVQNVYCLPESGAVLGREKGDIIFPHDKFMSSRHAQIYTGEDGHCFLVDLNSSNGTWIKLWEKTALRDGDYIFMGQQLFRVHVGRS